VFGYTVVAMIYQSNIAGIDAFFGKAIMGILQAFCFNWLYFEIDAANISSHAIRRHKISALLWNLAHLPFIMSFVLGSGALARLILVRDTHGTHVDMLTDLYRARSERDIAIGIRWFYCGGYGVALLSMGVISLSHTHKTPPNIRLTKSKRLAVRSGIAMVIIMLPLAGNLDSVQILGTVTGLVFFALFCELWACSLVGSKLWTGRQRINYAGNCGTKDFLSMVNNGGQFNLDELGSRNAHKDSGMTGVPM
jgi:low temperature requirement protein LtrA